MIGQGIIWGTLSVERFPPNPLQRLSASPPPPRFYLGSGGEPEFFGESLREAFFTKKVLSNDSCPIIG
jgi:hypothetical protein